MRNCKQSQWQMTVSRCDYIHCPLQNFPTMGKFRLNEEEEPTLETKVWASIAAIPYVRPASLGYGKCCSLQPGSLCSLVSRNAKLSDKTLTGQFHDDVMRCGIQAAGVSLTFTWPRCELSLCSRGRFTPHRGLADHLICVCSISVY